MDFVVNFLKTTLSIALIVIIFLLFFLVLALYFVPDRVREHPWYVRTFQNSNEQTKIEEGAEDQEFLESQNEEEREDLSQEYLEDLEILDLKQALTSPLNSVETDKTVIQEVFYFEFKIEGSTSWLAKIKRENQDLNGFYVNLQTYRYYMIKGDVYQDGSWALEEFLEDEKQAQFKIRPNLRGQVLIGHRLNSNQELERIIARKISHRSELKDFQPKTVNNIAITKENYLKEDSNIKIDLRFPTFTNLENTYLKQQIERDISFIANLQDIQESLENLKQARQKTCQNLNVRNCLLDYVHHLNYKISFNQNGLLSILFEERTVRPENSLPQTRYFALNYDLKNFRQVNSSEFFEADNWELRLVDLIAEENKDLSKDRIQVKEVGLSSQGFEVIFSDGFFSPRSKVVNLKWEKINFLSPVYFQ